MKHWICTILIFVSTGLIAQDLLYSHMDQDGIHLRWQGKYDANFNGYNVYRKESGGLWELLTDSPLTLPTSTAQSQALSGRKSEILYAMLGKTGGAITAKELADAQSETILFQSTCIINPELSWMLAERYTDSDAEIGMSYAYKITWLNGNKETDWLENKQQSYSVESVPEPGDVELVEGDGTVSLRLVPEQPDLKSGDAITWHIYRSENQNGPFEKVNYENELPISVDMGNNPTAQILNHLDRYLTNGTTYFYKVKMINVAGRESIFSKVYAATPKAKTSIMELSGFQVEVVASKAVLTWNINNSGVVYSIFSSPNGKTDFTTAHQGIASEGESNWIDSDYQAGMLRAYYIQAKRDNVILLSDTITISSQDYLPPEAPMGVTATLVDSFIVEVSWNASPEHDIIGYEVERLMKNSSRAGLKMHRGYLNETLFRDTLERGSTGAHYYRVFAIDNSYQYSEGAGLVKVVMPDVKPPQVPRAWSVKAIGDSVVFSWSASPDLDIAHFEVRGDGISVNGMSSMATTKTELNIATPDTGRIGFMVQAVDTAGNRSDFSDTLYLRIEPKLPATPNFTEITKQGLGLIIKWEAAAEPERIRRLLLTRIDPVTDDQLDVWQGSAQEQAYMDLNADPTKSWKYELKAFDQEWVECESEIFLYEPPRQ